MKLFSCLYVYRNDHLGDAISDQCFSEKEFSAESPSCARNQFLNWRATFGEMILSSDVYVRPVKAVRV